VGKRHEGRPTRGPSTHTQFRLVRWAYVIALFGAVLVLLISIASIQWVRARADAQQAEQTEIENARIKQEQRLARARLDSDPKRVKSATCLLTVVATSEPSTSVARSVELIVGLSVPAYAKECEATVTIDAPTFGLGKETKQTVSIVPPPASDELRWLLEPEKVGKWQIAVETQEYRATIPVVVTTPLGLSAFWAQVGAIAGVASTIALGALGLLLKRE
jgi:hypothetical protein